MMGVLAENGRLAGGRVAFKGRRSTRRATRTLRWRDIAFVPQSAMNSLDPVYSVGAQIVEVLTKRGAPRAVPRPSARPSCSSWSGSIERRLADYPHQFSGGMRQRASIALALALEPSLVLADEPVTALDVIVQRQILDMLRALQQRLKLSMVLVTHDISVVAYLCDEVVVMYAGQVVESGPVREVLARPLHPYTMGLRNAFPDLHVGRHGAGADRRQPARPARPAARLPLRAALPLRRGRLPDRLRRRAAVKAGHLSACRRDAEADRTAHRRIGSCDMAALVELRGVVKHFPVSRSLGEIVRGRASGRARAARA